MRDIPKPQPGEYPEYASMYIDLLPGGGRLLDHLTRARTATTDLVLGLTEKTLLHRYAPDRWTIKEILVTSWMTSGFTLIERCASLAVI